MNSYVPRDRDWSAEAQIDAMTRERDMWKRRADRLRDELANIPRALRDIASWHISDERGEVTYAILDPERHPKEAE
jgi:predicted  nucleic acid-binding Zn-ribbon protein